MKIRNKLLRAEQESSGASLGVRVKGRGRKAFLTACMTLALAVSGVATAAVAQESSDGGGFLVLTSTIKNGSFEEGSKHWNTTAEEKQFEFFSENNYYVKDANGGRIVLKPAVGSKAAELNADEESSLYQIVDTTPSSIYAWGLDHGARTESETMALVIGPAQDVSPSKNWGSGYEALDLDYPNPPLRQGFKYGKDQMMQMVAWLKSSGVIGSFTDTTGIANNGESLVVYSKKFAKNGTFQDDSDNQSFSLTPSSVYTERWEIWLMTDHRGVDEDGTNHWGHYGLNGETSSADGQLDLNLPYLYNVPSGQKKTMFAFTSVENSQAPGKYMIDPTFGNFLDGVDFRLFRVFSASTTPYGTVDLNVSNTTADGVNASKKFTVNPGKAMSEYVPDGSIVQVEAKITAEDRDSVTFAGVYVTETDAETGETSTVFVANDTTEDSPEGESGWKRVENEDGSISFTCTEPSMNSERNLYFVFVKSPVISYDANGGQTYVTGQTVEGNTESTYDFTPAVSGDSLDYVDPYTSHAAVAPKGLESQWKFLGWRLFDDSTGTKATTELLPAEHTVACNYKNNGSTTQSFVAISEGSFTKDAESKAGVLWSTDSKPLYDGSATGLTMVAQWGWMQSFTPQLGYGKTFEDSNKGGSVEIVGVDADDENYVAAYNNMGAKAYFAKAAEVVTAKATANSGYRFDGWYDEEDNLVSTKAVLSYVEINKSVGQYHARFSSLVTQQYKRQIMENGEWTTLDDADDSKVPVLDHTVFNGAVGDLASSTATNNEEYSIEGWYDAAGNRVSDDMVINDGRTISYQVSEEATYYARYVTSVQVAFKMQLVGADGSLTDLAKDNSYGVSLDKESVVVAPESPISCQAYSGKGCSFVGWFDGPGADANKVTDANPLKTNANASIYYARFKANEDTKYKVNHVFVGANNGKNVTETQTLTGTTGETVTPEKWTDFTKYAGYVYSEGVESKQISPEGDTTFTLKYTRTSTVLEYVANGGSGEMEDATGYVGWEADVAQNGFTRAGYDFVGWNTAADGSGATYSEGSNFLLQATTESGNPNILYAQWKKNEQLTHNLSYSVRYYCNGVLDSSKTTAWTKAVWAGSDMIPVAASDVNSSDAFGQHYSFVRIEPAPLPEEVADGSVIHVYYEGVADQLRFDANGGTGQMDAVSGKTGVDVTIAENGFNRTGYTFAGWNTQADGQGVGYAAEAAYKLTEGDDVLYAQWVKDENQKHALTYAVEYYKNGEIDDTLTKLVTQQVWVNDTKAPVDEDAINMKDAFGESYEFAKTDPAEIPGEITDGGVIKVYYQGVADQLTYDANGGSGKMKATEGRVGEEATTSENGFKRDGFVFTGWNTQADGNGESYGADCPYILTEGDDVLYAMWAEVAPKPDPSDNKGKGRTDGQGGNGGNAQGGNADQDKLPSTGDATPLGAVVALWAAAVVALIVRWKAARQ